MIISKQQVKQVLESYGKGKGTPSSKPREERKVQGAKDEAPIREARKVIGNAPEVREDRIRELKDSIKKGCYDRSGEEIANKMIARSLVDSLLGHDKE